MFIPYYTLEKEPLRDARRGPGGVDPLRKSFPMPLLGRMGRGYASPLHDVEYLHERQTSIILTGCDEFIWTAISLVDSADHTDSVDHLCESADDFGRAADPMLGGRTISDLSTQNPRLLLLWMWKTRIERAAVKLKECVYFLERRALQ